MAINNGRSIFGSNGTGNRMGLEGAAGKASEDFVPSKYWINVGYNVDIEDENGNVTTDFVALNKGIPVDTIRQVETNSNNNRFYFKAMAQNELLANVREATKSLAPGESRIFEGGDHGLCIQLLCVAEKRVAPSADENPFVRKLAFA